MGENKIGFENQEQYNKYLVEKIEKLEKDLEKSKLEIVVHLKNAINKSYLNKKEFSYLIDDYLKERQRGIEAQQEAQF